ncbi:kallikrein-4-like [Eurosta solidaginis]|uniref:kallikrein-4-like n=1 Tax=Eurosta solidaginis TaxID=178769 RepID=UPI003530A2E8
MCPRNHFTVLFILSCLLNYTNAQFRVINGEDIRIEKIPHSVAIFSDGVYRCVGALVNMNSVVTAAHCVISEEQDKLVVVAGVTDLRHRCSRSERRRGQRRNVQHIHHDYDPPTKLMDIAVVKVDESFEENNAVKPILLCDQQLVPGETMQVSGWGWISRTSGDYSHHLKTKHKQLFVLDVVEVMCVLEILEQQAF